MGNSIFEDLKKKFEEKHHEIKSKVFEKHKNALTVITNYPTQVAAGVMGAVVLATNPLPAPVPQQALAVESSELSQQALLISELGVNLPSDMRELTDEENATISGVLSRRYNIPVATSLEGIRLNRTYGFIGQEQHLARYPGDTMATHFTNSEDAEKYGAQGMAPGLGAWGYFAPSQYDLSQTDIDREKYYIATQTFLAPGFSDNVRRYIEFFKYRKMLIVNPQNGRAMVVVIGDAGPGESTGKHLGGSPEVMKYLERVDGAQKGPVLYYFIEDPTDSIPLGPIDPN